jgi:hypothetical protein
MKERGERDTVTRLRFLVRHPVSWLPAVRGPSAEAAARVEALTDAVRSHEQQTENWRHAHDALAVEADGLRTAVAEQGARLAKFERALAPLLALRRALRRVLGLGG